MYLTNDRRWRCGGGGGGCGCVCGGIGLRLVGVLTHHPEAETVQMEYYGGVVLEPFKEYNNNNNKFIVKLSVILILRLICIVLKIYI